jgi:cobyrinic acid a,c-diamide synthase
MNRTRASANRSTPPCLVVAGTHSGAGKTTLASALMAAYRRRGLRVQAFKVGPDFIDPTFHSVITGRPSYNLDGWMLSRGTNLARYDRTAEAADVCIVEGVMGLFDGRSLEDESGSTAEMAKWLQAPVLLVVDGSAMARSAGAVVLGFESFDPDLRLSGVLFNRVAGEKHFAYLRAGMETRCSAKPIGFLPRSDTIRIPQRHLGLQLASEVLREDLISALADWVESNVDLDALLAMGGGARRASDRVEPRPSSSGLSRPRIAVARDQAFQFYYQANLELLETAGADLVFFSPISDAGLPEGTAALYLGGGYPELYAEALAGNAQMRTCIASFAGEGRPVYAECGGFMYLTEAIVDQQGREYEMCALFPTRARMNSRLAALGYAEMDPLNCAGWIGDAGPIRGHEFRYSDIDPMEETVARAFKVRKAHAAECADGFVFKNVIASYFHLHFESCPAFAYKLVDAARAQC